MIMRLMLFIWWFTTPSASWYRWFTVISIALLIFLVNTGVLNPVVEQMWTPIRRHLDNLMPLAENHARDRPAEAANTGIAEQGAPGNARNQQPNPADVAARLLQERRAANANWLMTQVRRLERAGILFLASLAPGVAERHIANIEAEARAERQRREAEALAAAEAARNSSEGEANNDNDGNTEHADAAPEQPAENHNEDRPQHNEEPLIVI